MTQTPRFIVTGATGHVGQLLVPRLQAQGAEVVVVGRDRAALARCFPDLPQYTYDDFAAQARADDTVVHLAVLNNDVDADVAQFERVNVTLARDVATQAQAAGVARMIYVSSVHALDPHNDSPYARSKRAGAEAVCAVPGLSVTRLYLPLVYGDRWGGSLARLNRLPGALARALFRPLASLKPTVHIDRIAAFLMDPDTGEGPVILADDQGQNRVYTGTKRAIDLCFVAFVFGVLWWLLVLAWIAVRWESKGPGIFRQDRVGRQGKTFVCYKFRTMQAGTRQAGTHEVSAASVTRVGQFLRGTKIDELPQALNILRNEMSLIGPRPGLPVQEALFAARQAKGVFAVKPGISGLAQINGVDMSDPERLADWDSRYIALRGTVLDQKIILATALGRGHGEGAADHPSKGRG